MLISANRQQLQEILDEIMASMAIVEPDDQGSFRLLAANAPFFAMLGQPYARPLPQATLYDYLPTYAVDGFLQALRHSLAEQRPEDFRQAFDQRGQTSWWRVLVKPLRALVDCAPKCRLIISATDITEKIVLANQLQTEQQRYRGLFDTAYDGVLTIDREQRIKLSNRAAQQQFGYSGESLQGMALDQLLPERFRARHGGYIQQFSQSPIQARHMFERGEILCRRHDGSEFPAEISISKIRIDGETEFTAVIRDISERNTLIRELKLRANSDPLTGLRNRRSAVEMGQILFDGHGRSGRPLSVLMLDLDHFKQVNDRYGHAGGDAVLQRVAQVLDEERRKGDLLARIGGEEFLFLLADTPREAAGIFAERLRQRIECEAICVQPGAAPIGITCSIGIDGIREDDTCLENAIERADRALYRAKHAGRNRVAGRED